MTEDQTLQILDHLVSTVGQTLEKMNARLHALENDEGLSILDTVDWERQYPNGQLARHNNGLFAYSTDDGRWRVVSNGVTEVRAEGGKFLLTMSDDTVMECPVTLAKPRKKAA